MNIAIIGAGLSGLSVAWMLLEKNPSIKVTIFDKTGIGGGSSGVASGLLHPYSGATSRLNPFGLEGFRQSIDLLEIASEATESKVYKIQDLLRLATTKFQYKHYKQASIDYADDLRWLEEEDVNSLVKNIARFPGLYTPKNIIVNMKLYLNGLFLRLKSVGTKLLIDEITHLDDLKSFDKIIVAAGPQLKSLVKQLKTPLYHTKGQILTLKWPDHIEKPKITFSSSAYLVMDEIDSICHTGSSYERNYLDDKPDVAAAVDIIIPRTAAMFNFLENANVLSCRAGVRVSSPGHLPIIDQVDHKTFVITAMGSKGLLYHGLYAKKLAEKVLKTL